MVSVVIFTIWLGVSLVAGSVMVGLTHNPSTKDAVQLCLLALLWPVYTIYLVILIVRNL